MNYIASSFVEPSVPDYFLYISQNPFRRTITDYIEDNIPVYAFDPDHAMLAFSIFVLKEIRNEFRLRGIDVFYDADKEKMFRQFCSDNLGTINKLYEVVAGSP